MSPDSTRALAQTDAKDQRTGGSKAERVAEAKPLYYILQNLERAYGVPENRHLGDDPLDMLISVILSQATTDTNSGRTFAALKRRFPTWDDALRARETTIARTIQSGGLARQKARVIKDLLQQLKHERGALDLGFLRDLTAEAATQFLARYRGVGPKTIACTLLFACDTEVFPLDTHIFRVLRRIGLVPARGSAAQAHEQMTRLVPTGKFYSFHVNLIRHGRRCCRPRAPLCDRCPVVEYCDYANSEQRALTIGARAFGRP